MGPSFLAKTNNDHPSALQVTVTAAPGSSDEVVTAISKLSHTAYWKWYRSKWTIRDRFHY